MPPRNADIAPRLHGQAPRDGCSLTPAVAILATGRPVEASPELSSPQIVMSTEGIAPVSPVRDYVLRRYANLHELIVGLIRQGIERGEIRQGVDADWEASALVAYLDGIKLQWFYSDDQLSLTRSVQHYFDLLVERLAV